MDTDRLFEDLTNCEDIKDIPLMHITRVAVEVVLLLVKNGYYIKEVEYDV